MKYICPFCYKTMPPAYEPSGWGCCGEVGHAMAVPECHKCGAEIIDTTVVTCEVCGADTCGCSETYPQLIPGKVSHGPGCRRGATR